MPNSKTGRSNPAVPQVFDDSIKTEKFIDLVETAEPALSSTGEARLFAKNNHTLQVSINGGAYEEVGSGSGGNGVTVRKNTGSPDIGTRPRLNFIEGANITLTIADDAGSDEVDITITGSGTTGAPATAQYLTLATDGNLDNERVFVAGAHLSSIDGGANGNFTVDWDGVSVRKNTGSPVVGTRRQINFIEGSNVTLTVADDAGSGEIDVTIASAATGGTIIVRKNSGADVGTRPRLNFIEGSNVTLTVSDDAGDDEVDITIAAGAGSTIDVRKNTGSPNVGSRPRLNFIEGTNITLTIADDPGSDEIDITIASSAATTPGGANTNVQFNEGGSFGGDAEFTWDTTNKRLNLSSLTTANDNATNMVKVSGTMPTTPSTTVFGVDMQVTGSGSASQGQNAARINLNAGYTGASLNRALAINNSSAGTGTTLNLGSVSAPALNASVYWNMNASTTGYNVGAIAEAQGSTGLNAALYGRAAGTVAGANIAILGSAANSTEGTDLKNVAIYGTLNSSLISGVNGSFAGLFDGGTLPDAVSRVVRINGTLNANTSQVEGVRIDITGNGSAAGNQVASVINLLAGYTGSSITRANQTQNASAGTGNTLNIGSSSFATANMGTWSGATASTSGSNIGIEAVGSGSTANNIGVLARTASAVAGSNIAVLGTSAASTEATDLKNIAGYFTLRSALISASNISSAIIADNGSGADSIFRGYDNGSLVYEIGDGGAQTFTGGNGATWVHGVSTENITLNTGGTTTNSSANLLPANAVIQAVLARVTTTITTATDWSIGDANIATRFSSANTTLTAGTTSVGLNHMKGNVGTEEAGPTQTSAAPIRITTAGTPGAGAIRVTVFFTQYTAPIS